MNAESDERREVVGVMVHPAGDGTEAAGSTAAGGKRALGSRAPRFIKAYRPLHLSWQVGVFLVGLSVVAAGVIMLLLPGPGWLVIFAGMAIWATEFVWAQLVLHWTKRKVTAAAQKALEPRVRRRNITLTTMGLAIIVTGVSIYSWKYGFATPWEVDR